MKSIFLFILVLVCSAACSVFGGFALQHLWAWFVMPQFAVPLISLPEAVGLNILAGFLTHTDLSQVAKKGNDGTWWEQALGAVLGQAIVIACVLATGAIVKEFL